MASRALGRGRVGCFEEMRPGRVFGRFGFRGSPVEALKSAGTCLYSSHAQKIALALAGFALALIPGVTVAQEEETRPTIAVSGLPTRISQPVDWSIAVTDLVETCLLYTSPSPRDS